MHLLLALLAICFAASPSAAQDRAIRRADEAEVRKHALVVGNDAYRRSPLVNAVNDANAMRRALRDTGFSVETVTDADYPTFDRAIDRFVDGLGRGDVGLFYYAGHGVQVDGGNYLIPVDFDHSRVAKVKYRAIPADLIRERMESSGARLAILVLDACRDNPFHGNRSAGPHEVTWNPWRDGGVSRAKSLRRHERRLTPVIGAGSRAPMTQQTSAQRNDRFSGERANSIPNQPSASWAKGNQAVSANSRLSGDI